MWWAALRPSCARLRAILGRTTAQPTASESDALERVLLFGGSRRGDYLLDLPCQMVDQLGCLFELFEAILATPGGDVRDGVGRGVESGAGAHDVRHGFHYELLKLLDEAALPTDQDVGKLVDEHGGATVRGEALRHRDEAGPVVA